MPQLLKDHVAEALTGLAVVAIAIWFLVFALGRTGSTGTDSYSLTARFPNAAGIAVGSDVRVSGLKVGTVTRQKLDPASFQAVVTLTVDKAVQLPLDSSAAITSEGLLGGSFIALVPGGDSEHLAPGDEITDTQGATDLMGLIGSVINRSGEKASDGDAAAQPAE
ncbi:outer membrane lipid asymmetry maintenance protein MlaD [Sandaracinobacter sp. RS1-74]|uniref:outer membrane lipid asymmetry maintenance protein MlaD n=1 Tax=Sandaracinobacteroides sayramensis TaxID=2913411 RepID=UPI001EDB93F5|nr:outer membrane lipid asymmetry maintenance protein MlaD [Sandaracinobacteroides sayramensis]MCG2842143.1 outer membrane lipid asymmetry maintenance protein MlaD [Sandaracinobacteroides sayramensis]